MTNKLITYPILYSIITTVLLSQSMQELQKMKSDYEIAQNQIKIKGMEAGINDLDIEDSATKPKKSIITQFEDLDSLESKTPETYFFGYDFFTQRDINKELSILDNLPPPSNYILGPGDELIISLWGETELRAVYNISRDGTIYVDKVGILSLTGKTIDQGKKYLISQFGRIYSTMRGSSPTTYMDVSLGSIRSINISIVGEVKFPGVYAVHSFSTLITGLIQAGGVDTTGSLRKVMVKRKNEKLNFDLYNYLIKGDLPNNIQLRDQDIIIVPVRETTIKIDSAVVRPGVYEAIKGETIKQLISYAGGLLPNASSVIGIKRRQPLIKGTGRYVQSDNFYFDYFDDKLYYVYDGDNISVHYIFDSLNKVEIIGQVRSPGVYHYYDGMTLFDLMKLGGGFDDKTFLKTIYTRRAELIRRDENSRYDKIIEINLNNLLSKTDESNIKLENLDRLVVHANLNFFEKENVSILGEVNIPGNYPILKDSEKLNSIIKRAGGFTKKASKEGIEIIRDSLRVASGNNDIIIFPGDSIIIRETQGIVHVKGSVYNEGLIAFQKGKSLNYYIDSAGGITPQGDKKDIIVIYSNGIIKPKKMIGSPLIKDGATIVVNEKENQEPFRPTEFANTTLSLISSLITIIVLSRQISN